MKDKNPAAPRPLINGSAYPRIGLALGSGAAKAICQFGILKRLTENNIPISYITGSSMGAILGGVYALGLDLDLAIEKAFRYAEATNINNLNNFNFFHESLYKNDYTENLLTELFADFNFEDCKIPFSVTTVDLEAGGVVVLDKGPLVPAIRASTSIPGIFAPALINGKYLVDGGLLEDCPVTTVRERGQCDLLIGSYIKDLKDRQFISAFIYNKFYKRKKKTNIISQTINEAKENMNLLSGIVLRSLDILRAELWKYKKSEARPDLIIEINVEKVSLFDFKKIKNLVREGEKAFDSQFVRLAALIEGKKKELNG